MSQRPRLSRYQWEGVYAADFTLDAFWRRVRRVSATMLVHRWSCLVAHDTRFMAGQFARFAYRDLKELGIAVHFCQTPVPFPAIELALEQRRADTALLVSAGNRPFWFNGMIVVLPALEHLLLDDEPAPVDGVGPAFPASPLDSIEHTPIDLRTPYLEVLRGVVDVDVIRRAMLTVFIDPMNGTATGYVPAAIGEGGQTKAIEINRESDPLFGRQSPQPSEAGLTRLRKLVRESDSHLGIAIAADGRAIGVVDNQGEMLSPSELALLLAQYLGRQYRQRGAVVLPRVDEHADVGAVVRAWEASSGLRVEYAADPSARAAEVLSQDRNGLLVSVTVAGEIMLGRYGSSPDATLVALLLIEMVARSGGKLRALVNELKGVS